MRFLEAVVFGLCLFFPRALGGTSFLLLFHMAYVITQPRNICKNCGQGCESELLVLGYLGYIITDNAKV
jgi:hypothetical protein